ncbi:MAG: sugar transferase, partial [Finegoldia magna]|nr:sugar transferase [Finegoldia magna]
RKYVDMYSDSDKDILKIRPGITDLASIKYRDESEILDKSDNPEKTYVEEIMPNKIELNKQYIENINLLNDIKIILQTLKIL